MLCNWLHKFENVISQVVTLEIWNPMFKNIGNQLHAHGNWLLLCKTVIKLFGLVVIDYCLMVINYQRVKTLVKDFSLKISFGQIVLFNLLFKKIFLYLSWCFSWSSCISWVFSWIFTWILIEWLFDSWSLLESWSLSWVLILVLSLWHHQNKFGSFASTISSFLMMTNRKSREYMQVLFYRSLISFSPFLFEFMLNFF